MPKPEWSPIVCPACGVEGWGVLTDVHPEACRVLLHDPLDYINPDLVLTSVLLDVSCPCGQVLPPMRYSWTDPFYETLWDWEETQSIDRESHQHAYTARICRLWLDDPGPETWGIEVELVLTCTVCGLLGPLDWSQKIRQQDCLRLSVA